ncbi:MAG: hypothetical protein E7774_11870 [Bradyrhizobium sp.]|nr:MAG: hypothetical protein E7774_11870 [Bradyrhizobium sp.]
MDARAYAFPPVQKLLVPPLREFVVGSVPALTERELMECLEVLYHLKFGEVPSSEGIDVVNSTPKITVFPGSLSGEIRGAPRFYTSELHGESGTGGHDGVCRGLCGIAEGKYVIDWSLGTEFPVAFDDCGVSGGLTRILQNQQDRPMPIVAISGLWPTKLGIFYQNVGAQLTFRRATGVAYLDSDHKNEEDRRDRKGIVDQLIEKSSHYPVLSDLAGVICGAIGITIYVNSLGWFGAAIGFALIAIGILTPVFPWWAFVL